MPGEIYITDAPNALGYLGQSVGGQENMDTIIKAVNLDTKATIRWVKVVRLLVAYPGTVRKSSGIVVNVITV